MNLKKLLLSLAVVLCSSVGFAQTIDEKVDKRKKAEHQLLHKNVKTGEVSKKEDMVFRKQQPNITSTKKTSKGDTGKAKKGKATTPKKQQHPKQPIVHKKDNRVD